jgi:uncharacterized integral membrane protein
MKKTLIALLLTLSVNHAFSQYEKYYSDEVASSSSNLGLWAVGSILIAIIIFGDRSAKKSAIYFIALFALPLGLALLCKLFFGLAGSLIGGFAGLFLWYKFGKLLDK